MATVNVSQATVMVRSVSLTKNLLKQARVLDYTELRKLVPEPLTHTIGWIAGKTLPDLDEWSRYLVINYEGDLFLYAATREWTDKTKQIYLT